MKEDLIKLRDSLSKKGIGAIVCIEGDYVDLDLWGEKKVPENPVFIVRSLMPPGPKNKYGSIESHTIAAYSSFEKVKEYLCDLLTAADKKYGTGNVLYLLDMYELT